MGLSYTEVAKNLSVDLSTVKRVMKLFKDTGNVSKKRYDKSHLPRKVTNVVQFCILQLIIQYPGIKLREIRSEVSYLLQVELDESTICRFVQS
jgi:transposase